jgi:hypothetical protein
VNLQFEPLDQNKGWKLDFAIAPGPRAQSVELPLAIAGRRLDRIDGARFTVQDPTVLVDSLARRWTAFWS